jgi:hypothetical protein
MGNETELKFEVALQDLLKLKAARILNRGTPKQENLVSVYFDTPNHKFARNGVSLRVRHNSNKRLQIPPSRPAACFSAGSSRHRASPAVAWIPDPDGDVLAGDKEARAHARVIAHDMLERRHWYKRGLEHWAFEITNRNRRKVGVVRNIAAFIENT